LVIVGSVCYIFTSNGKRLFGMLSYNLTYDIRKNLYESVLVKNIGYFDFPENSTFVLSGIMQADTTLINGVATDQIPPKVEGGCLLFLAAVMCFWTCW